MMRPRIQEVQSVPARTMATKSLLIQLGRRTCTRTCPAADIAAEAETDTEDIASLAQHRILSICLASSWRRFTSHVLRYPKTNIDKVWNVSEPTAGAAVAHSRLTSRSGSALKA